MCVYSRLLSRVAFKILFPTHSKAISWIEVKNTRWIFFHRDKKASGVRVINWRIVATVSSAKWLVLPRKLEIKVCVESGAVWKMWERRKMTMNLQIHLLSGFRGQRTCTRSKFLSATVPTIRNHLSKRRWKTNRSTFHFGVEVLLCEIYLVPKTVCRPWTTQERFWFFFLNFRFFIAKEN